MVRLGNLVELVEVNLDVVRVLQRVMQKGELLECDTDLLGRLSDHFYSHVSDISGEVFLILVLPVACSARALQQRLQRALLGATTRRIRRVIRIARIRYRAHLLRRSRR